MLGRQHPAPRPLVGLAFEGHLKALRQIADGLEAGHKPLTHVLAAGAMPPNIQRAALKELRRIERATATAIAAIAKEVPE